MVQQYFRVVGTRVSLEYEPANQLQNSHHCSHARQRLHQAHLRIRALLTQGLDSGTARDEADDWILWRLHLQETKDGSI